MNPKILFIIPAYNEEKSLPKLVESIKNLYPQAGILIVNDGSGDQTALIAKSTAATLINLPFNLGIGGAIQTGFRYAVEEGFDIAVQIDGDGQHDPKYISHILKPVIEDNVDLCIGSRFLESGKVGFKSTLTRRLGIQFFSWLLGLLLKVKVTDPTSGFRVYGPRIVKKFSENYPIDFPEPEAIALARIWNMKISEVPVRMRARIGGISSIRYFATLYYMVKVTLAILIDLMKKNP